MSEMVDSQKITFRQAIKSNEELLKNRFSKPHVKELWDNSSDMWGNMESYLNGQKVLYDYWIGFFENDPYCLVITSDASENDPRHLDQMIFFFPGLHLKERHGQ